MEHISAAREKSNYIKYCFCKADNKSVDSHYKSGASIKYYRGRRGPFCSTLRKAGADKKGGIMSVQSRRAMVFVALLASMTVGTIVLMALGNNPPSAGEFCLSGYYHLDPIEKVIVSRVAQFPDRWSRIEICDSDTKAGNIKQLASLSGLNNPGDINCHFVICNGLGAPDGQIQSTEKWRRQWSISDRNQEGSDKTIRICVISDGESALPTDFQIKRKEALVEGLCRKFDIRPDSIYYSDSWQ
jgi:hypothetical protein